MIGKLATSLRPRKHEPRLVALGWDRYSAFDSGDAEMSREVQQIKRADGPRNGDEVNLAQPGMQDCNVADRIVLELEKEFCAGRQALLLVTRNHALPSRRMAFGAECVQSFGIVPGVLVKAE